MKCNPYSRSPDTEQALGKCDIWGDLSCMEEAPRFQGNTLSPVLHLGSPVRPKPREHTVLLTLGKSGPQEPTCTTLPHAHTSSKTVDLTDLQPSPCLGKQKDYATFCVWILPFWLFMWVSEHCKYKVFAAAFHLCHRQILLKLTPSETVVRGCVTDVCLQETRKVLGGGLTREGVNVKN